MRMGWLGCGRGLLAATVMLMSATTALASDAEALKSDSTAETDTLVAEYGALGVETHPLALALAAHEDSAPSAVLAEPDGVPLLAAEPLAAFEPTENGEPEAAAMFRVSDLEAGIESDGTVNPADGLAQITQVTDFSDVLPSDWAFQALSNLVETYGCIEGYPDRTFRGQRSITRYEFAAGLNACLDVIVGTLSTGISDEDLATIRRLQEEFAAELASLTTRVDQLEAETAELAAQQFSTVTKLRGQVFSNLGIGTSGGNVLAEGASIFNPGPRGTPVRTITGDTALTVGNLLWLNFDTSFSGADRLKLQLVTGSGTAPANVYGSAGLFNTFGTPFVFQTGAPTAFDFAVRELSYAFPVGDSLTIDIGPRINWYAYFDNNRYTFFLTGANSFNSSGGTQVNAVDRGTGAIAVWDIADWLDFRVGYLAENTEFIGGLKAPDDPTRGLFGGTSTITGQLGIRPFNNFNLRLLYTRSNLMPNGLGQIGGTFGEPIYGFADDGVGGPLTNAPADTFLVNFDWTPVSWLGLFGRYSYGTVGLTSATTQTSVGSVDAQSLQFGLAFPNLFKEGAQATISYLVPFSVINGRQFLVSGAGDGGRQQEIELSYRYPLSRNIALMPSVYWILEPNNFSNNPDIFIFNLQTQLSF
ncbi:iron uptake porin [Nodosilinea sp. LEGE 07088]|uniref:iron uptake porin n=1 Tax=Nodosilinea sp. LEGE 07088 TaxID=2777968 RepID=UPI001D1553C2|nr:iron uptake porin [Nodosilinea sp. LEGE 07088]